MSYRQALCKYCKKEIHKDINEKWEHNHNGTFYCNINDINSKEAEYGGWFNYG